MFSRVESNLYLRVADQGLLFVGLRSITVFVGSVVWRLCCNMAWRASPGEMLFLLMANLYGSIYCILLVVLDIFDIL